MIQNTSKNVSQNAGLEPDALNTLGNSCISSDKLFQRKMPDYSLELILPGIGRSTLVTTKNMIDLINIF